MKVGEARIRGLKTKKAGKLKVLESLKRKQGDFQKGLAQSQKIPKQRDESPPVIQFNQLTIKQKETCREIIHVQKPYYLYIKQLPRDITTHDLKEYFSNNVGKVDKVYVRRENNYICAYIYFDCFYDKHPKMSTQHVIENCEVVVHKKIIAFSEETHSLMIRGRLDAVTKETICNYFKKYGRIEKYSDTCKEANRAGFKYIFLKFSDSSSVACAVGKCHQSQKYH